VVVRRCPDTYALEIAREAVTASVGPDNQEANMWSRFARLITSGGSYGTEADDPLESWDFWPRVALATQAVMDACVHSAYTMGGAAVDVVVP